PSNLTELERIYQQQPQAVFLQIYPRLSQDKAACCTLQVSPGATAAMVIQKAGATLGLDMTSPYALLEVRQAEGEERRLGDTEMPVERVLLWPPGARKRHPQEKGYYFILQAQGGEGALGSEMDGGGVPSLEEYDDLCSLSTLTEDTILAALRLRFYKHNIYTYARGILVAINPFKFLPIYNPKYVMMYNNQPLGKLSPHIFAVADVAYHTMLKQQENQCVVISGESGSGKTQSTNFLIHCLTALSQKGYSSGVKRTILGAGPVLEAFGNAKTAQNNNSSRFGKFIRVNYLKSGVVRGAVVEKYLLEKCRLVFRAKNERNYHVFYYLLVGASKEEQREFRLLQPEDYTYLQQEYFHLEDAEDLRHEFERLHQAMEMVGFLPSTKKQIFSMLSAILYLGNVTYTQSEDGQALEAGPADVLSTLSDLLKVKQELLMEALTKRKQTTANDKLVLHYTLKEAVTARDSMAKSLYSSLFDWIVLRINHALLNRRDMEEAVSCLSIGILDIFGFEDFQTNSFEQFCINYANEKLQYYFNQHIFKLEQKEYQAEGISWSTIDYTDNLGCIHLISQKPTGLFHLLDEESNLPQATDDTLLNKFKQQHQDNPYFVPTTVMLPAFVIQHFAGKVKYQIKDFRKKNTDHMRPDIVALLRSSERAFMRQLIGSDPVAVFRWGILRATIRIIAAFNEAGSRRAVPGLVKRTSRQSIGELKRRPRSALQRLSSSLLDFSFDRSDDNPLEVFEDIFANYEKKNHEYIIIVIHLACKIQVTTISVFSPHRKSKASKHKQLIPTNLMNSRSLKHIVGLTLHDRASRSLLHPHQRKKPPSISAQFQASLNKLLETVGKAEPFFIRCIRSNAEKKEMLFDNALVQQQLRYTGMLETVRIQKSGYNAKFTFTEFLEQFKVLLPKEATTAPEDIANLLQEMGLGQSTYQIGKTKVFLKEREKQHLQDTLNREVMRHIVILQRWFRACLSRSHFLYKKDAAIRIQRCWRAFRSDTRCRAATVIQAAWRGSQKRTDYLRKRNSIKKMQTLFRNKPDLNSLEKKELRRQHSLEPSPNRSLQPGPEVNRQEATQRNTESEKREGRGSPPPLNRPLSLPLDPNAGRYDSLPSLTSLPLTPSFTSDLSTVIADVCSGSGIPQVRVRSRKVPNHKRRLAYARSGLMFNLKGSQESEFWSFPLPPMSPSPGVSGMGQSNQPEVHIRPRKPEVQVPTGLTMENYYGPWHSISPYSYPLLSEGSGQPHNPSIRISRAARVSEKWNASLEREITNTNELRNLDEFLGNQVNELRTRAKKLSATESIFLTATMQFRETIKGMYSISKPHINYKGLLKGYQNRVSSLAEAKQQTEVQSVVNLFQSVLDGFIRGEIKRAEAGPVKVVLNRVRQTHIKHQQRHTHPNSPLDHMFSTYQVNIMQSCDLCGSFIWGMEKAYMCSACKLICHKKCLSKIINACSTRCDDGVPGHLHFGVQVCVLTSKTYPIPMVVQMMLEHVEMNGLYTEGIYRKSGSACHARELHQLLETKRATLEKYSIHTVTGLVKRWLRELPEPLLTFSLYNDFLHAVELPEQSEQLRAVYQKLDDLPPSNFNTLERLVFHLVRVAKEEEHNRMSANSLAIVFAPCILRSPDTTDPFLSMKDISKITTCVEILILEQFRRYNEKMQEITELEFAEALAVNKLMLKRQNTVNLNRSQAHRFVSTTRALLDFSRSTVSCVNQEWSTTQRTSSQLLWKHWSLHGTASQWNTFDTL
uniref:Myosin IXb n=1 Tax=Oncorhynchus kisutch TaxID=8019 RepID=A0A8C7KXC9_ONCKI